MSSLLIPILGRNVWGIVSDYTTSFKAKTHKKRMKAITRQINAFRHKICLLCEEKFTAHFNEQRIYDDIIVCMRCRLAGKLANWNKKNTDEKYLAKAADRRSEWDRNIRFSMWCKMNNINGR
jgi:hypothetical protein